VSLPEPPLAPLVRRCSSTVLVVDVAVAPVVGAPGLLEEPLRRPTPAPGVPVPDQAG